MSRNEYSDSSDDDVYFGEYTLKEAKKDLRRNVTQKINRRHTSICKLTENMNDQLPILVHHFEEKFNISSNSDPKCPSEYLTPNESVLSDGSTQNSEFLEKLNKVINEPLSEASSYNTAFDQTNNCPDNNINKCEDTFLERMQDQPTFALDHVHHTLVENTVISDEQSSPETSPHDKEYEKYHSDKLNESIITISDDSLSQSHSQNSAFEFITKDEINVAKSPIMSNGGTRYEELLSEAINDEDFESSNETSCSSITVDHHMNVLEREQNEEAINEATKAYFGFKRPSLSDSDPNEYSSDKNEQDSSGELSNRGNFYEDTSCNLNLLQRPLQKYERVIMDCNQLSKISEKTEFTTCIQDRSSLKTCRESSRVSTPDSYPHSENSLNSEQEKEMDSARTPDNFSSEVSKISSISGVSPLSAASEANAGLEANRSSEATSQSSSAVSPVQVPKIEFDQFDDSCQFDDTLEEMNRFLAQGADYVMPERITVKTVTPVKETYSSNEDVIISGSFMNSFNSASLKNKTPTIKTPSLETGRKFHSAEKITTPRIEVIGSATSVKPRYQESKIKPPKISARNLFSKHNEKEGAFKVPNKPLKKVPTPSKTLNPALKNVVSPVGMYIKHSPKYCPLIKAPQSTGIHQTKISKLVRPDPVFVKENIPCASDLEFPQVIYRPATNKVTREENDLVLPGNIKKLIRNPVAIKHEQRIQNECNQSIERRLMESDLTIDLSDINQDVSVLTNKQVFNTKF